jgi:hypothetical protein
LTNVGASNSGIVIRPLANFHHLLGRKFPSSVLNQACYCGVYCGSHSNKGHRNKAAVSEAEICSPVRAAHLASLSAFWFPWTIIVSPFWCPLQCLTTTHLEAHIASSNFRISSPHLMFFPLKLMSPLSSYGHKW